MLLAQAKSLELSRIAVYKNSASKIISPDGKAVLLFLARAEEGHFELLKKEMKKLNKIGKLNAKEISKIPTKQMFKKKELKFNHTSSSIVGDMNIIKTAIKIEKRDAPFYAMLAKKTAIKDAKKLFLVLKKAEEIHLALLKNKLKNLQSISMSLSMVQSHKILF